MTTTIEIHESPILMDEGDKVDEEPIEKALRASTEKQSSAHPPVLMDERDQAVEDPLERGLKASTEKQPSFHYDSLGNHDVVPSVKRTGEARHDKKRQAESNTINFCTASQRIGKGSKLMTKMLRKVKYPWVWIFNRLTRPGPVSAVKVMSRYLPTFYLIPKEKEGEVLPYTKRHIVKLHSGRTLISRRDITRCGDSQKWYQDNKQNLEKDLVKLKYSKELIEELDKISDHQFGRCLKFHWDSCVIKGQEEIKFQNLVRE